jgi:hypothetical protein
MQARAGHINEAREAVLQAARQHGAAAVKTAASTLSSLQVRCNRLCIYRWSAQGHVLMPSGGFVAACGTAFNDVS